ncbi:aspartate dehydrogenase [Ruegeria marisrubri]|uniref:L-aspartate dehydrogenase n=1 Tax=Ruegeria marisrubri TaxID=1685379 RepID=A0A0X3U7M7_9RHOB|nr:aspartate dehydrogenase [Ruegeria marisrubri]KUJ82716.1 aspartate dehydrogenase [Ruegeria marisrubri]
MHLGLIGNGNIARGVLAGLSEPGAPRVERITIQVLPGQADAALKALPADLRAAFDEIKIVDTLDGLLAASPELVAECAGQAAVRETVPALLRAGIDTIVVSIGALSDAALHHDLCDSAVDGGAKLILPPGAVGGIDIINALRIGGDIVLRYSGTKPPGAWTGTPAEERLELATMDRAATFFTGTARDASAQYPKNANVAATLALAGAGFEATAVDLVADPAAPGNVHEFTAEAETATVTVRIVNRPSAGNAKTSQVTIYSVLRAIRNQTGPLVI